MRKINEISYESKIEFWQILTLYKNFDPENILPSVDERSYYDKVHEFLILLKKYKPNKYTINSIIDKIHREIFSNNLEFEMLIILRKISVYLPSGYIRKKFEFEDENSYELIKLNEQVKIKSKLLRNYISKN